MEHKKTEDVGKHSRNAFSMFVISNLGLFSGSSACSSICLLRLFRVLSDLPCLGLKKKQTSCIRDG